MQGFEDIFIGDKITLSNEDYTDMKVQCEVLETLMKNYIEELGIQILETCVNYRHHLSECQMSLAEKEI
jgi:hypothetical protein